MEAGMHQTDPEASDPTLASRLSADFYRACPNQSHGTELLGFLFLFFPLFFVSGPCARLSWPPRQLLSVR